MILTFCQDITTEMMDWRSGGQLSSLSVTSSINSTPLMMMWKKTLSSRVGPMTSRRMVFLHMKEAHWVMDFQKLYKAQLCTLIIFTGSAQHAAINFPVWYVQLCSQCASWHEKASPHFQGTGWPARSAGCFAWQKHNMSSSSNSAYIVTVQSIWGMWKFTNPHNACTYVYP